MMGMPALKSHAIELEELCNLGKHDHRNLSSRVKLFTFELDQALGELESIQETFEK